MMIVNDIPPIDSGWSVFVVELSEILHAHNKTLNSLDIVLNGSIVQRLRDSKKLAKRFTILNPFDFALICEEFHFTFSERQHLVSAMLVTSIQAKLSTRFGVNTTTKNMQRAREVAFIILNYIEMMITEGQLDDYSEILSLRDFTKPIPNACELFNMLLDAIDRGNLALNTLIFLDLTSPDIQTTAHEAYIEFDTAIHLFEQIPLEQRPFDWEYWHCEAEKGRQKAMEYSG